MQLLFHAVSLTVLLLGAGDFNMVAPWIGLGGRSKSSVAAVYGIDSNGHVGKKGPSYPADYANNNGAGEVQSKATCAGEIDFEISRDYIIRTKDSEANGATFVSALPVRTYDACLEQCCLKEKCDTTIFVRLDSYEQGSEQPNCFLFECRPQGETGPNLCLFTYHNGYVSSIKKIHGGFQSPVMPVAPERPVTSAVVIPLPTTTQNSIQDETGDGGVVDTSSNCGQGYFECASGECVNALYVCNNIFDCRDESDEYGCSPPSNHEQQTNGQDKAPAASIVDTDTELELVVTVVAPLQDVIATSGKPLDKIDVVKPEAEANFATHSDQTQSGGGGGMPPASSAILPLVIGLVITMCLLLMVGCRLRYMNQRLRYGRLKTNAQDADYLINGMYL